VLKAPSPSTVTVVGEVTTLPVAEVRSKYTVAPGTKFDPSTDELPPVAASGGYRERVGDGSGARGLAASLSEEVWLAAGRAALLAPPATAAPPAWEAEFRDTELAAMLA
jgi:hypothetical protein